MLWDEINLFEDEPKKPGAVFTHVNDEDKFFPLWLNHYSKYYDPKDIYVLAHNSNEEFEDYLLEGVKNKKFNLMPVTLLSWFNSNWITQNISIFQWLLLQSYKTVLYADVDEFVFTDPDSNWKDLKDYYLNFEDDTSVVKGYHILTDPYRDAPIDINLPITEQRNRYLYDPFLDKPLIATKHALYNYGQHTTRNISGPMTDDLIMFHLHYIDIDWVLEKDNKREKKDWSKEDLACGFSSQNLPANKQVKMGNFFANYMMGRPIPEKYIGIL